MPLQVKLPTHRIPQKSRSAVRFIIVGTLGTLLQISLYDFFLFCFGIDTNDSDWLVQAAFALAFVIETTANYLATSFYTFERKPDWKNAGGFALSRGVNYLIQAGLLALLLWLNLNDRVAGIVAILIAGVINYFILNFIFRRQTDNHNTH